MQHIREAFSLFGRHKFLWIFVTKPLAWTLLLYFLLLWLGYVLLAVPIGSTLERFGLGSAGSILGILLYGVLGFYLSGVILISIASLLSSLLWDRLSLQVEELVAGSAVIRKHPLHLTIEDSAKRAVLSLSLGIFGALAGLCIPIVAPALVAGYISLLDFTAPAFARRGKLLRAQRAELKLLQGRHSFALAAGVISVIPILNVVMLPILVAAGTIMVARTGIAETAV